MVYSFRGNCIQAIVIIQILCHVSTDVGINPVMIRTNSINKTKMLYVLCENGKNHHKWLSSEYLLTVKTT